MFTGNEVIDYLIWFLIIAFVVIGVIGLYTAFSPSTEEEKKEISSYGSKWTYFFNQTLGIFLYIGMIIGAFIITAAATIFSEKLLDRFFGAYSIYPLISFVGTMAVFFGFFVLFGLLFFKTKFFARYYGIFGSDDNGIPAYLRCRNYIEENRTKIGLFVRPSMNKYDITLANKYCAFKADLLTSTLYRMEYTLIDKVNGKKIILKILSYDIKKKQQLFFDVCKAFSYDTTAGDIFQIFNRLPASKEQTEQKDIKQLYLDINEASEAELTAIPGINISRAKHAVKVRKKQIKFLTANQFFKAIDLNEEYIEHVQVKGNKILLNNLPEYKMHEIKKEL